MEFIPSMKCNAAFCTYKATRIFSCSKQKRKRKIFRLKKLEDERGHRMQNLGFFHNYQNISRLRRVIDINGLVMAHHSTTSPIGTQRIQARLGFLGETRNRGKIQSIIFLNHYTTINLIC